MRRPVKILLVATLFAGPASAATFDVTTCGQTIPDGDTGILQNDLVCAAGTQTVRVGSEAKLELNGHSITALGSGSVVDVHSVGGHTVRGPGQLINITVACGVGFDYTRKLLVEGVDIVSTSYAAIDCLDQDGHGDNRLTVRDVDITGDSTFGILGRRVKATNVTIEGSDLIALLARRLKGRDVTIIGNAGTAIVSDAGYARSVTLVGSDIRDNAGGIIAETIRLRSTTVTGNGAPEGYDLKSLRRPILRGTSTCERSLNVPAGGPWGVCTND